MNQPEKPISLVQPNDSGWIFNIQRYSIQDGPGVRTTVFFLGCPLSCLWCSNPESQSMKPQLSYTESRCTQCQSCIQVCPSGAISVAPDGSIKTDRDRCNACSLCVPVCPNEARSVVGKLTTVDEVMTVIKKDSLFYRNSRGGVTASGGEPLSRRQGPSPRARPAGPPAHAASRRPSRRRRPPGPADVPDGDDRR